MSATRIKALRKEKGMTQAELGNLLKISASTVGMYEQGRRDPDTETLLKLAHALDVSVDYLIMASDIRGKFDIDKIAKDVAQNLINNESLMFSADCYTQAELDELENVIETSIKKALTQRIEK